MAFTASLLPAMHQPKLKLRWRKVEPGFVYIRLPPAISGELGAPARPYGLQRPTKRALPPSSCSATPPTRMPTPKVQRPKNTIDKRTPTATALAAAAVVMQSPCRTPPEAAMSTPEAFSSQSSWAPTLIVRHAHTTPTMHQGQHTRQEHKLGHPRKSNARRMSHPLRPKMHAKCERTHIVYARSAQLAKHRHLPAEGHIDVA